MRRQKKQNSQVSDILVNEKSDISATLSDKSVGVHAKTANFVVYRVKNASLENRGAVVNLETGEGNKRYDLIVIKKPKVSASLYRRINLFYDALAGRNNLPKDVSVNMREINKINERIYYHATARAESCRKMLFKADNKFTYQNLFEKFPTPKSKI
jgi:hypothetical protein